MDWMSPSYIVVAVAWMLGLLVVFAILQSSRLDELDMPDEPAGVVPPGDGSRGERRSAAGE